MTFQGTSALDIAILAIVGLSAILGLRRGFIRGVLDLAIWAAAILVAMRFRQPLEAWLDRTALAPFAVPASFLGVFMLASGLLGLVAGIILGGARRLPAPPPLPFLNSLLGLLPGLVKGVMLAAALVGTLMTVQGRFGLERWTEGSRLAPPLVSLAQAALGEATDRLGIDPSQLTTVIDPGPPGQTLPFAVTDGLQVDRAAEQEMLAMVNAARAEAGLAPVVFDEALAVVARAHAEEMFREGYFAHESPITGTPSDRLAAAGIPYLLTGENLALAQSIPQAHEGLMDSPGHRANILNPSYAKVGIGVVRGQPLGLIAVQQFTT